MLKPDHSVLIVFSIDPEYANDTSGCTAVAGLILEDNTIIVVRRA